MSSSRDKGKKKTTFNPEIPPFEEIFPSSPPGIEPTLPSPTKRPRSETTTSLRDYTPELDPKQYWTQWLLEERKKSSKSGKFSITLLITCLTNFLAKIQKDYTNKCVRLSEQINTLQDENSAMAAAINSVHTKTTHYLGSSSPTPEDTSLRQEVGSFHQHTLNETKQLKKDLKLAQDQLLGMHRLEREHAWSTPAPAAPPPTPPPPSLLGAKPPPPSTWAQVARKGKKKNATPSAKPTPAVAPASTTPKAPSPKKGLTLRERRLIVKRDGTPLSTLLVAFRDSINSALNAVIIQRVECNPSNDLLFTTMEIVRATSPNSKISQFLHLIPGTTTVHLDSPIAQLLVHGIPTSHSLADIGKELTTFDTGLALAQQPRRLLPEQQRAGKLASTVVIQFTGPKEQDFAALSRLFAFSTTFRLEHRLHLGPRSQCANCQRFGHHTLKCVNPAICCCCAKPHSTGDHTCPTATCPTPGRLCAHSSPLCANCDGPHEEHSTTCSKRPVHPNSPSDKDDDPDSMQMVGT